jgi:hypothetical protein
MPLGMERVNRRLASVETHHVLWTPCRLAGWPRRDQPVTTTVHAKPGLLVYMAKWAARPDTGTGPARPGPMRPVPMRHSGPPCRAA